MRLDAVQDLLDDRRIGAVAADEPVLAEEPDVARPADGSLGRLRDLVGIGEAGRAEAGEGGDLVVAEAGQRQVEAEAFEIAELERQQFGIPAGVQRQLVVGDDVGALLRLR